MYNFRDTTEFSEGAILPSEAMSINGIYIENIIAGYRTLQVQGREALSPEIETTETGIRDGSRLASKRYPARIITITYQLIAESNEAFREAYNQLAKILNVENAELIFNDEPDKYFVGTPSTIQSVDGGRNAVKGEFEILCVDPFKYSVEVYEAIPSVEDGAILIDYNGTYKAHPTLEAEFYHEDDASEDGTQSVALTGKGDCGYVAFFNDDEKIIQLGNPNEENAETFAKSQTLTNTNFSTSSSWGVSNQSIWAVNKGLLTSEHVQHVGTLGRAAAEYEEQEEPDTTSGVLLKNEKSKETNITVTYNVSAKTYERASGSVNVEVTIKTGVSAAFGTGRILEGSIYIGGQWYNIRLKKSSESWKKNTTHTKSKVIKVSGLQATDTVLDGIKFKVERLDDVGDTGVVSEKTCNDLKIRAYVAPTVASYYLTASDFKTGAEWHGPSITRTIPADASGEVGAANFKLSYSHKMSIGSGSSAADQRGAFQALLVSGSGSNRSIVAGIYIYKRNSGNKAKARIYVNNKEVETIEVDLSYGNKKFNIAKTTTIEKNGSTVTFNIGGTKKTYVVTAAVALIKVTEVTFSFFQFGTLSKLKYNGLCNVKFVKNNCDTWENIPNMFSANDVVEADCNNGEIYLNGVSTPALGALGNDWEGFVLKPGFNQIGFSYSDWVEAGYEPSFKVKYREVFL